MVIKILISRKNYKCIKIQVVSPLILKLSNSNKPFKILTVIPHRSREFPLLSGLNH